MDTEARSRIQYFARPGGHDYHVDRGCPRLSDGAFEAYRYRPVAGEDIRKLRLAPCRCVIPPSGD